MAISYFVALCVLGAASAGLLPEYNEGHNYQSITLGGNSGNSFSSSGPSSYKGYQQEEEHYAPAHYEFKYAVEDKHTGDIKEQQEKREGDKVVGFYTLIEPDGHRRIVHYEADKHSGFTAKVDREYVGIQVPQPQQYKYESNYKY